MTTPRFGQLLSLTAPDKAIQQHLQKWMPTFLREVGRQNDWPVDDPIAFPKRWVRSSLLAEIPGEDATPTVLTAVRSTSAPPRKRGDGRWDAEFDAGVMAVVGGPNSDAARDLAGLYGISVAAIMLMRRDLDGLLAGGVRVVSWDGVRFDDLRATDRRTMSAVRVQFTLQVESMLDSTKGPTQPDPLPDPDTPYPDLPTAASIEVIVKKETIQ